MQPKWRRRKEWLFAAAADREPSSAHWPALYYFFFLISRVIRPTDLTRVPAHKKKWFGHNCAVLWSQTARKRARNGRESSVCLQRGPVGAVCRFHPVAKRLCSISTTHGNAIKCIGPFICHPHALSYRSLRALPNGFSNAGRWFLSRLDGHFPLCSEMEIRHEWFFWRSREILHTEYKHFPPDLVSKGQMRRFMHIFISCQTKGRKGGSKIFGSGSVFFSLRVFPPIKMCLNLSLQAARIEETW